MLRTEFDPGRGALRPARHRVAMAVAATLALVASACGGGGDDTAASSDSNVVDAGGFRVELPDDLAPVEDEPEPSESDTADTAADDNGGTGADDSSADESATEAEVAEVAEETEPTPEPTEDPDAIPLEDDSDPITGLFDAFDSFNACLNRLGTEFIGPPSPDDPATQDPEYLADLQVCASESNILQALEESQAASANRTLEEIEAFNEGTLIFVDCMRGKGWTVADPVPDEYGSLQIGTDGGLEPPPGETLLGNPVLRECAADAQRQVAEATAENS